MGCQFLTAAEFSIIAYPSYQQKLLLLSKLPDYTEEYTNKNYDSKNSCRMVAIRYV